jgi:hypothetical protein
MKQECISQATFAPQPLTKTKQNKKEKKKRRIAKKTHALKFHDHVVRYIAKPNRYKCLIAYFSFHLFLSLF